ncbi:MAG: CRISPR-associated RAMP protein Csx10 [Limnoraphis robusta]
MNRIQLEIEALSPLAIGRHKPGGSISEAQDYIPGSVIRGAFASVLLQPNQNPEPNDDFHALFLNENSAIFQNAYPANPAVFEEGEKVPANIVVTVFPETVLSSKAKPGFKNYEGHGVFDTLIDRFCAEDYGQLYDPNCPTDSDRVDNLSGFYCKIYDKYHPLSANKRLLTRVGINRKRATAEESILYSIEVLNESQPKKKKPSIYRGAILVSEELAKKLLHFIERNSESFRLGGSTSRGLGKVKIQAELRENSGSVKDRIKEFDDKLKERWQLWGSLFSPASGKYSQEKTYFTLDLQSDAILTEKWQRTTVISEAMLKEFAGIEDSSLKLEVAYSSYDYSSGWNAAWGLMKDVELVTNKGGVYLFSTTKTETWYSALENLENKGVGERTHEGFGQIQICNEFHLEFQENAV